MYDAFQHIKRAFRCYITGNTYQLPYAQSVYNTEQIATLRKQLKLNKGIEERSLKIQEKTDLLYANEYRAKEAEQNRKSQRKERDAR